MNYYFLISSLPHVAIGETPSLSMDAFTAMCEEHLQKEDMAALAELKDNRLTKSNNRFIARLNEKETILRNAIVRQRSQKLNRDPSPYISETSGFDSHIEKAVADAFSAQNPLEKEFAIDKIRCEIYEEVKGLDPFSPNVILAYAAKLRIAERWAAFDRNKGQKVADTIINKNPNDETLATTGTPGLTEENL